MTKPLIIIGMDEDTGDIVVQKGDTELQFSFEELQSLFSLNDRVRYLEDYFRDGWRNNDLLERLKALEKEAGVNKMMRGAV
jgi:hypothetical protein